jgi:hypothetical protein
VLTDIGTRLFVLPDLITNLTLGNLDVVLLGVVTGNEMEEAIVNVRELVLSTGDVGDIHIVSGRAELLQLLVGENIDGDEMDLGVTVLAGLRGAHLNDLAGTTLDDNVTVGGSPSAFCSAWFTILSPISTTAPPRSLRGGA